MRITPVRHPVLQNTLVIEQHPAVWLKKIKIQASFVMTHGIETLRGYKCFLKPIYKNPFFQ